MDTTQIARYAELHRAFTPEQLERLPLEIAVFDELPALIDAILSGQASIGLAEDPTVKVMEAVEELKRLLRENSRLLLETSTLPWIFWVLKERANRPKVRKNIKEIEDLHGSLVREYSFAMNFHEIQAIVDIAYGNSMISLGLLDERYSGVMISSLEARKNVVEIVMKELTARFQGLSSNLDLELLRLNELSKI